MKIVIEENNRLKEEVTKFKDQISTRYVGGGDSTEAKLHLVFLFSTPLVVRKSWDQKVSGNFKEMFKAQPLLEFKKEFKEIKESLKETKKNLRVRSLRATIHNLSMILGKNPLALHFTGHGTEVKNPDKTISHSLLLEYEDGEAEEVSEKQLIDIIRQSNADLEFVFVASCYSEFAGKAFLNAGARHVICVKSGN